MVKQIICDKCDKALKKLKNISMLKEEDSWVKDIFGEFQESSERHEGSIIIVNLPKYKIKNKVYDLCENCTKIFLKVNIQKWLGEK